MTRGRDLTDAFKEAIFSKQTNVVFLTLVTIEHADLITPVRLVPNTENITSNGNIYYAAPVQVTFPPDSDSEQPRAKVSIDNIDRIYTAALRSISSPPTVSLEIIRADDPDTIEIGFYELQMRIVKIDPFTIEGDLTLENFLSEPFPGHEMGPAYLPGLF